MEFVRYGVITATSPRMTTQDAPTCQVETFERSMLLNGLNSITGACGGESARRRQQRRDACTIEINGKEEDIGEEGHVVERLWGMGY